MGLACLELQMRLACAEGMPRSRTLRRQAASTLATAEVIEAIRMVRAKMASLVCHRERLTSYRG
jgi:hypothetical protein